MNRTEFYISISMKKPTFFLIPEPNQRTKAIQKLRIIQKTPKRTLNPTSTEKKKEKDCFYIKQ
jgi:hypothetical protein